MKKLKKFLKELWMERSQIFQALAYIGTIAWYGLVLRIVASANIHLLPTILVFIGGIVLAFFTCVSLHKAFSEDEKEN